MKAYVLVHSEWGVFLGHCLGLYFWSKIDSVGQPACVAFESEREGLSFMVRLHENSDPPPGSNKMELKVVEILQPGYATIAECVAASVEGWLDEDTPTAGSLQ